MKKFLFMAIAMLTMAFAFTSCSKDDDTNNSNSGSNNSGKEARTLYFLDNGCQYLNRQYKLTVGTETKILKVDTDLKKVTEVPVFIKSASESAISSIEKVGDTATFYSYEIPTSMHGAVAVYLDYSIKDGVELPEAINVLFGAFTYFGNESKGEGHTGAHAMPGLMKEAVQSYLERMKENVLADGNLK